MKLMLIIYHSFFLPSIFFLKTLYGKIGEDPVCPVILVYRCGGNQVEYYPIAFLKHPCLWGSWALDGSPLHIQKQPFRRLTQASDF